MNILKLLQYGGQIRVNNPINYEATQDTNVPLKAFLPDQIKPTERPEIDTSDLDMEGYDSDLSFVSQQLQDVQREIQSLPEPLLNSRLPSLMAKARKLTSPEYINRLKVNYEQGEKARSVLVENEGMSAWLTNPDGSVMVRQYDPTTKTSKVTAVDIATASQGMLNGIMQPIKGAEAWQIRNDEVRDVMDGDGGNRFHTAMGFTKGNEKVIKEIEDWKSASKDSYKESGEAYGAITGSSNMLGVLLGKISSSELSENNKRIYDKAISAASNSLSATSMAALRNHATMRLLSGQTSIDDKTLKDAGMDINSVLQGVKNGDANAKQDFQSLINLEKHLLIAKQLSRHVYSKTDKSTDLKASQWMNDRASGDGNYKTKVGKLQSAYNGWTDQYQMGASGKYGQFTLNGRTAGTAESFQNHKKNLRFEDSNLIEAMNMQDVTYADGTPVPKKVMNEIMRFGTFTKDTNVLVVDYPYIDGKPLQTNQESFALYQKLQKQHLDMQDGKISQAEVIKTRDAFEKKVAEERRQPVGEVNIEYVPSMTTTVLAPFKTEWGLNLFGGDPTSSDAMEEAVESGQFEVTRNSYDADAVRINNKDIVDDDGNPILTDVDTGEVAKTTLVFRLNNQDMQRRADGQDVKGPSSLESLNNLGGRMTTSAGTSRQYGVPMGDPSSLNNP